MAPPRHKRDKPRSSSSRLIRRAVPLAAAATLASSAAAVAWPHYDTVSSSTVAEPEVLRPTANPGDWGSRVQAISRSEDRVTLESKPEPKPRPKPEPTLKSETEPNPVVADHMFMTTALNVWSGPGESFELIDVLPEGTKIGVTGETDGQWAEVVLDAQSRWVNADYLSETKPKPDPKPEPKADPAPVGLSDAPCDTGSDVESGLAANGVTVHRAVCAEFPQVETYYGVRPGDDGEHGSGHALDIMVGDDSATGDAIAEFVQDHYKELGVSQIIWSQRIWTVERSSEGWRWMEDRGSTTANHYDHVHVTVY
ncbi:MAG: SH3 domain-containing protein [Nocardioidaceae bacterium]